MHSDSNKLEIHKKISTASTPSLSSIQYHPSKLLMSPSTSGLSMGSRNNLKQVMPTASSCSKISTDPKAGRKLPPPFKKAQSQSHIQVKSTSNRSAHITVEHEKKKLKKSRSFDKNNYLVDSRHTIESKKTKTKH